MRIVSGGTAARCTQCPRSVAPHWPLLRSPGRPGIAADFLPPAIAALHAKAENGNAVAQYNLGLAYAAGRGVAVDQAEALSG